MKWVQGNIKYVAFEDWPGRFVPRPPRIYVHGAMAIVRYGQHINHITADFGA